MARKPRIFAGGVVYHVMNRASARAKMFHKDADYFKAFPVQAAWNDFQYLRKVCRYVERNPLRAHLVKSADEWKHEGLWRRVHATPEMKQWLAPWPEGAYPGDAKWLAALNQPLSGPEENALASSLRRQSPFGAAPWRTAIAADLGIEHTLRKPGRPKKAENDV